MTLDRLAQRYGLRPSAMIGIADSLVALDFDAAVAMRGSQQDAKDHEEASRRAKDQARRRQ